MLLRKRPSRLTAWLFVAWLPLMSMSSSASFGHAHADGDEAHHHHGPADHGAHHHAGDARAHRHDHGDTRGASVELANAAQWHTHVWFFGMLVHLPNSPQQDTIPSGSGGERTVVSLWPPAAVARPALAPSGPPEAPAIIFQPARVSAPSTEFQRPLKLPFPLCDRARHERSGVQLA